MANLQSSKLTLTKIQNGQDGQQGVPGYNAATIFLYARVQSQPSAPSNTLKYIFSSGTFDVTTPVPSPWSQQMPQNNNYPCYVAVASAVSNIEYDEIESNDWTVQELVENGAQGAPGTNGADGYNFATIYLYQRAAGRPSVPTGCTYKFSNNSITGNIGNWQRTVPDNTTNTNPCWVTTAVVYSQNDENNSLSFVTPTIMVKDGENGQDGSDGTNGYNYIILYYYIRSATTPTKPSGTYSYDFENKQLSGATITDWTTSIPDINVNHDPCWVTTISFLGNTTTVSGQIFSNPVKLVEDGENGENGLDANQYRIHTNYQRLLKYYQFQGEEDNITPILYIDSPLTISIFNSQNSQYEELSNFQLEAVASNKDILSLQLGDYCLNEILEVTTNNINNTPYLETIFYPVVDDNKIYKYNFDIGQLYNDYKNNSIQFNSTVDNTTKQAFNSFLEIFFDSTGGNIRIVAQRAENMIYVQCTNDSEYNPNINYYTKNNDQYQIADIDEDTFNDNKTLYYYTQINKSYNIEKFIELKNGLSDEMMQFSINARNIHAAIESTGLQFDINGLTITNGGFTIQSKYNDTINKLLYYDDQTQNLNIVGNGSFTGSIYATNGTFNGTITSYEGIIGGFTIGSNSITSNGIELISGENSSIKINNGTIGNVILNSNGTALSISNPYVSDSTQKIFEIQQNGKLNGPGWSITPRYKSNNESTSSLFEVDNIIAEGTISAATLSITNFITEKTRSMGGSYIFKPTFQVLEITKNSNNKITFKLKNATEYLKNITIPQNEKYIVYLSDKNSSFGVYVGNITDAQDFDSINSTLTATFSSNDYSNISTDINNEVALTMIGITNNDVIIGINSDNDSAGSILPPRALVMRKFDITNDNVVKWDNNLFLGDFTKCTDIPENITGYGLYADNVFLRGSLVTQNTGINNNYAGVNTQGPVNFDYATWKKSVVPSLDNQKIIFWGGASSTTDESIQTAPFIVTDKGSIYAISGEFRGSVISESTIANSIIEAPIIKGKGNDNGPSLKIYDTNTAKGGIGFYKLTQDSDELTLLVNTEGFLYKNKKFINFNENDLSVNIQLENSFYKEGAISLENKNILLWNNGITSIIYDDNNQIIINNNKIENITTNVISHGKIEYIDGSGATHITYKKENNYYCLYVGD